MTPKSYAAFVHTAKSLANKGESYRLQLMHLLIEMEAAKLVWYKNPHATWDDVLRAERVCTMAAFVAFKKAIKIGLKVDTLGVAASCLLAKLPLEFRGVVVKQTTVWVDDNKVPPNYQLVSEYVKHLLRDRGMKKVSPYAKVKAERDRLKTANAAMKTTILDQERYTDTLKNLLRRNRIPLPK